MKSSSALKETLNIGNESVCNKRKTETTGIIRHMGGQSASKLESETVDGTNPVKTGS